MHHNQCNRPWFQTGFPGSPGDFSGGVTTLFAAPCITTATSTLHLSSFLVARYPSSYFNQWVQIFQRLLVRSCLFLIPEHIPVESHLGFVLAGLSGRLFGNKEMRLLMLGLDAAGKTSKEPLLRYSFSLSFCSSDDAHGDSTAILYKLKLNQSVTTIPTGALSYNLAYNPFTHLLQPPP
jgi:hypothetical protein